MCPRHPLLALCLILAVAPASAAAGDSLYKSLQEKGGVKDTPQRRTQAPSSGFVERMREKGIEPIPETRRTARITDPRGAPRGTATETGKDVKITDEKGRLTGRGRADDAGDMRLSDPSGKFTGRVMPDGRGGFRTFDAMGRHTKTLTPDGQGGYRVYDASGHFQGRVKTK